MPTGAGYLYSRTTSGKFKWTSLLKKSSFSYEAIEWISFLETHDPFFSKIGKKIQHAMNGGEVEINHFGRRFHPDGFLEHNGIKYLFFYDGCVYHTCQNKCTDFMNSSHINKRDDIERNETLSNFGVVKYISSCEWRQMRKPDDFKVNLSYFFNRKTLICENELKTAIENNKIFGIVQCDIQSTHQVEEKFMRLNFPPVFQHTEVTEELIGPSMLALLKSNGLKLPLAKQLTLCFNATNHLITTDQFLFYKRQGFILKNISLVIEYQKDKPLKKFVDIITEERKNATRVKDDSKQQLYKLVANSSYGRMGMNLEKQKNVTYISPNAIDNASKRKAYFNAFTKYTRDLIGEYPSGYTEIVSKKKKIVDKIPVHMSFFVLANSKLHFLEFIAMMLDYWDTNFVKLLYMDTG